MPLAKVTEAQYVDSSKLRRTSSGPALDILGSIKTKFVVRQELAQAKMAQIRQQTEDAEKARLSRKTVTIEEQPKGIIFPFMEINAFSDQEKTCWANDRLDQPVNSYGHTAHPTLSSRSHSDSQHSWSPLLTEHAATPPAPLDSLLDRHKTNATADRKPLTDRLLSSRATGSKQSTIHQLEDEFGRRYREYVTLNRWMDNRLAVFNQLQTELVTVTDKSKAQEQVIFRVVVEEQRLKDDREYQENAEKLEECCAALMMIKSRLASAVKAHK